MFIDALVEVSNGDVLDRRGVPEVSLSINERRNILDIDEVRSLELTLLSTWSIIAFLEEDVVVNRQVCEERSKSLEVRLWFEDNLFV